MPPMRASAGKAVSGSGETPMREPEVGCRRSRAAARLRRFGGCRRGNVGLVVAASMLPMLTAIGGAVDFGRAYSHRTLIGSAADAAALAGARDANEYLAVNGRGVEQQQQARAVAEASAKRFLNAKLAQVAKSAPPSVVVTTQIAGRQATVSVKVSGSVPTQILSIAGIRQLPFSAASQATMKPGNDQYYQVVFVVDVSNSMGIGGTPAAISELVKHPQIECAFACHDPKKHSMATEPCGRNEPGYWSKKRVNGKDQWTYTEPVNQPSCDKRAIAKQANIKLKIDYVNEAVNGFINDLKALNDASSSIGHYHVGLYTFGTVSKELLAPTSDLAAAGRIAAAIDIEEAVPHSQNYGYTYVTNGLRFMVSKLRNVGDGSSATAMKTFVIFISDAVEDEPGSMGWGRKTGVGYGALCRSSEAKAVTVFSIWTGYSNTNENQYKTLVAPIANDLPKTMRDCASSSSHYFLATDGPAIHAAVDSAFKTISVGTNLRLTQ